MTVVLALSYSGRDDIVRMVKSLAHAARAGKRDPDSIDERTITGHLDTAGIPDPDLLIRTSGEMRISNFFLWQIAYSEMYITSCLWPDFREKEYLQALLEYQRRRRRFGRTDEQLDETVESSLDAGGRQS
jgi:undecaprenyl diphosphate synthase